MNYILRDENAIYYECGYSSDNALYLRLGSDAWLITDSRYTVEATEQVRGASVVEAADLLKAARSLLRGKGVKRLVFDPKDWSVQAMRMLEEKLPTSVSPPYPIFRIRNGWSSVKRRSRCSNGPPSWGGRGSTLSPAISTFRGSTSGKSGSISK